MQQARVKSRSAPRRAASSPTDVPTQYALDVVAGRILTGPLVKAACRRHLDDLENGHKRGLSWSRERMQHALDFFPGVLMLNGGEFEGIPFELQPWQAFIVGSLFGWLADDGFRRFRVAYIEIAKGNGKALSLDTPIPTPRGWTTMGALRVGEQVFDEHGKPCRVVAATEVMVDRPCYRLRFSDGAEIVADADHQWITSALRNGGKRGPKPASEPRKGEYGIRTTREIAGSMRTSHCWNHRVDIAGALVLPDIPLPVPPYTLGAWLGDGDSDCARLTMAFADAEITEAIQAEGVSVDQRKKHSETTGRFLLGRGSLNRDLRSLALLGQKHIPPLYLRAGTSQRIELLRGLMDTDGYCSTPQGVCEFTSTSARLASDVTELVRSLGFKAGVYMGRAMLNGRDCGPKWRITFTAPSSLPVFRLTRKVNRQKPAPATRPLSRGRMIIACDPIESVPVRCIQVDSTSSLFLAGEHMVPTHNSPLAAGMGLYCLIADGEQRAEVFAAATKKDQAMVLFRDAVAMVNQSPELHSRLVQTGGRNPYNLFYPPLNSFFRAISSDDGQSGPRPHCALIDEVHEHQNDIVVNMLKAGQKGRRQPLSVEITNSGFDRSTVCYAHHSYTEKIVNGAELNDEWFGYISCLDPEDDPLKDESCWMKANPNLGVSVTLKYIRGEVREALGMPSKASKVRRLNFCMWVGAENPWIDGETWMQCEADFDLIERMNSYDEVVGALDLSGTKDFTALTLGGMNEIGEISTATEFWTPKDSLEDRAREDKKDYVDWVERGFVIATPGSNVNYRWVAQRLIELQIQIPSFRRLAFDPYRIKYLEEVLNELGAEFELVPHPQGYYKADDEKVAEHNKKLKPGERPRNMMWMPRSVELLEQAVMDGRFQFKHSPALTDNSASAVLVPDAKNNRIFDKRKSRGRIDGIVSTAMCVGFLNDRPPKPKQRKYQMFTVGR